ncbi:hypothetical protein FRC08_005004 [Ceratobasidium sp. 394]|nr:hypothetical protein FRC08_005004 [Ceratobasidium sp. 394]
MLMTAPVRKYTCGNFTCTWIESDNHSTTYLGASCRIACYEPRPPSSASSDLPPSSGQTPTPQGKDKLLAAIEFRTVPHKPKVQIYVYARDLLRQMSRRDGLADLDHVVLGAVLLYGGPLVQRHNCAPSEGWNSEEALQDWLWSRHTRPAPGTLLPLYSVAAEAVDSDDLPPPYEARISLPD